MGGVTFLLGAGASVDAGLPTSVGMTSVLMKEPKLRQYLPVLQFVIGGIQFGRGIRGTDATKDVNVEELFEAVDMLASRNDLPVAPFVGLWSEFTPRTRESRSFFNEAESAFSDALNDAGPFSQGKFIRLLKGAFGSLGPDSEVESFSRTSKGMIGSLRRMLLVRKPDLVSYLKPLVDLASDEQLTIATLNYDNCVELAADVNGIGLTTALDDWSEGMGFRPPNQGILLLKLHGSLTWDTYKDQRTVDRPMPHDVISEVPIGKLEERPFMPGIIFGAGNKLTANGPYLDLLRAFHNTLSASQKLVVVGYGFGDGHINEAISRWLNGSGHRSITVIGSPKGAPGDNAYCKLLEHLGDRCEFHFLGAAAGLQEVCERSL